MIYSLSAVDRRRQVAAGVGAVLIVSHRLTDGLMNAGLRKLRKEVRTCEYHDVHVMWQMLRATEGPVPLAEKEAAAGARKRKNAWRRFIYYCCAF
jgi:hypothetical protein